MTPAALIAAMEATWPPAASHRLGPWRLRQGAGGGKRVSAATLEGDWTPPDLGRAEDAMRQMGQDPLFMLRPEDATLDAHLEAQGYRVIDPVLGYAAPVSRFDPPPYFTTFPHWPPLQITADLWAAAHIGPERLAVMHRVQGAKTVILSRARDRASGVAFVAQHGDVAMLHALEVSPDFRRQGAARNILSAAAHWAAGQGAATLALVVTRANTAARTLYASLGMQDVGQYHYRQK